MGYEEEVKSEVQEMNKSFGFETADGKKVDDEVVETPEEEPIDELEPETEPEPEPEETETPPDDEERIEEEEEPEDEKDKVIAELRKKLGEKEAVKEPEPEPEPTEEPIQFEAQEFLDEDVDLDDLVRDPKILNEVFNKIYQRAVTDTRRILGEGVLRSIPDIVRTSVDIMDKLKKMNDKFYSDNSDLKPFNKVVAAVFEEVATENPGKDMMDLLPMVADESRKRLELHKKATTDINKPPRLPRRKQRTTLPEDKPNPNPLLKELEEMSKVIRR